MKAFLWKLKKAQRNIQQGICRFPIPGPTAIQSLHQDRITVSPLLPLRVTTMGLEVLKINLVFRISLGSGFFPSLFI